jgi:hypothetical protein
MSLIVGITTTIVPLAAESAAQPFFGAYALEIARVCSLGVGCNPDQEQSQGGLGAASGSGEVNISESGGRMATARAYADLSTGKLGVFARSQKAEALAAASFRDRVFLHVIPTITGGFVARIHVEVTGAVMGLELSPDLGPARFGSVLHISVSYHDDSGFYCSFGCQHEFPDGEVELPLHDEVPFIRIIDIPIRLHPNPAARITPYFEVTASLNAGGDGKGAGFSGPNTAIGLGVQNAEYDFFNTSSFSLTLPAGVTITSDSGTFLSQLPVVTPPADTTPPTTTTSATPRPNANGWNTTNVVVALNATDNAGGTGVKEIAFSLNGAQGETSVVAGSSATVTISTEGTTVLTFFARDNAGNEEAAKTLTVRIDKTPPTLTCDVSPGQLWPPNHKLVPVTASVSQTDVLSGPAGFVLTSITSNEGDTATDIQGFAVGAASVTGQLRADRRGDGAGRTYTLVYSGQDLAGNSATCSTTVVVPHDQR